MIIHSPPQRRPFDPTRSQESLSGSESDEGSEATELDPVEAQQSPSGHSSHSLSSSRGSHGRQNGRRKNAESLDQVVDPATASDIARLDTFLEPYSTNTFKGIPPPIFLQKRHKTGGNPAPVTDAGPVPDWRPPSNPMLPKTTHALLVLCLHPGYYPPDICRPPLAARLECFIDPTSGDSKTRTRQIGQALEKGYMALSARVKHKKLEDPHSDDFRAGCQAARDRAKGERAFFHYNGHGVPRPTVSGEIWVFNSDYTQYMPVSLSDFQTMFGSPGMYVWDTNYAGVIVQNFLKFSAQKDGAYDDGFHMAACEADQTLPMNADMPADLFTSCLISPVETAIRFFILQDPLAHKSDLDNIASIIPGIVSDRKTPLGELNWILTAITDSIAYEELPPSLFRSMFRRDPFVAVLFRNFLLAERIMRAYGCSPVSSPKIPQTHNHELWNAWDLAVDACLTQARARRAKEEAGQEPAPHRESTFFSEQLLAFEVWLRKGGANNDMMSILSAELAGIVNQQSSLSVRSTNHQNHLSHNRNIPRRPPTQLPILIQVLLSSSHRLHALIILSQFLDLGAWAVNVALGAGIFIYVLKLLQSPSLEVMPILIFIWARISAVDRCQIDLAKDNGYDYFVRVLSPSGNAVQLAVPNVGEHRSMCAFILANFARDYEPNQTILLDAGVLDMCLVHLDNEDFLVRQWSALCISQIWAGHDKARVEGHHALVHNKLVDLLSSDPSSEVRAAALYAMATFMGAAASRFGKDMSSQGSYLPARLGGGGSGSMETLDPDGHMRLEVNICVAALASKEDASPMVRKELVVLWSALVREYQGWFILAAYIYYAQERGDHQSAGLVQSFLLERGLDHTSVPFGASESSDDSIDSLPLPAGTSYIGSFLSIFTALLDLSCDAYTEVRIHSQTIVDYVIALLLSSAIAASGQSALPQPPSSDMAVVVPTLGPSTIPAERMPQPAPPPIRRNNSFAADLLASFSPALGYSETDHTTLSPAPDPHYNYATYRGPYCTTTSPYNHVDMSRGRQYQSTKTSASTESLVSAGQRAVRDRFNQNGLFFQHRDLPNTRRNENEAQDSRKLMEAVVSLVISDQSRLNKRKGFDEEMPRMRNNSSMSEENRNLRNAVEIALPLKSRFFDWCSEFYTEGHMKLQESEAPGSATYNEQAWRRSRNDKLMADTSSDMAHAGSSKWEIGSKSIGTGTAAATKLLFHQFDNHLVSVDHHNSISVVDWSLNHGKGKRLQRFDNGNPEGTSVSSMFFVNEHSGGMLLTASSEGNIRIYRDYADPAKFELATSFRALSNLRSGSKQSGIVVDWHPMSGELVVGGDSSEVRVWDGHREQFQAEFGTSVNSPLTSLACDQQDDKLIVAGFGDGSLRVYDRRVNPDKCCVIKWQSSNAWVDRVRLQRRGTREISSACVDGSVYLWDLRRNHFIDVMKINPEGLTAYDFHDSAAVFGMLGIPNANFQSFRIGKVAGESIQEEFAVDHTFPNTSPRTSILPASNFRIPRGSLAFHPHLLMMAVGTCDGKVRLVSCEEARRYSSRDASDPSIEGGSSGSVTGSAADDHAIHRSNTGTSVGSSHISLAPSGNSLLAY